MYTLGNNPLLSRLIGAPNAQMGGADNNVASDSVVQMQQLLLSILGPMLQNILGGQPISSFGTPNTGTYGYGDDAFLPGGGAPGTFGPVVPGQSLGGVDGFFRDVANGLGQGTTTDPTGGYGDPTGGYGPSNPGGGYGTNPGGGYGTNPGGGYDPTYPGGPSGPTDPNAPTDPNGNPIGETIDPNLDYRNLSTEQRRAISGMSDRERAVLHLWGIQMTSQGSQDGSVLNNVLQNPDQFQPAEVALARELAARDEQQFGGITGKALDQEFFGLYQNMTGRDISGRYGNAPVQFSQGPLDMNRRLTGENGLSGFENQVLQLWGHAPLFNQGQIDGNIVDYALNSGNALEANLNRADLIALREADLASDGVLNGDSLENAFVDTLDRLYLGAPGASADKTMNDALQEAALRRQGLLPPPEPGARPYTSSPYAQGAQPVDGVQQPGQTMGGGGCPFLAGGGAAAA